MKNLIVKIILVFSFFVCWTPSFYAICPTTVDFTFTGVCANDPTVFTVNTTDDLSGSTLTWDFGDGNTATGVDPTHTYTSYGTKTITLTITGPSGCSPIVITKTLTIDELANYYFQSPTTGCVNEPTTITPSLSISIPREGEPLPITASSFSWDFGDGFTSIDDNTHTYATSGVYDVILTITYANGCTRTISTTATITCCNNSQPNIFYNGLNCFNESISFSISDNTIDPTTVTWDFGDGTTTTNTLTPTHTYSVGGSYIVTLNINSANGASCNIVVNRIINIHDDNEITILGIGIGGGCTNEEELVVNGNFNDGLTGFNSGLTLVTDFPNQGEYLLTNDATTLSSYQGELQFDHTNPGSSEFLLAGIESYEEGGTPILNEVWTQSYTVLPNVNYNLALWGTINNFRSNTLSVSIQIAGEVIATQEIYSGTIGAGFLNLVDWTKSEIVWNSGNNTSAEIKIIVTSLEKSKNPAIIAPASVVGIDDISFTRCLSNEYCKDQPFEFSILTNDKIAGLLITWDFGDNTTATGANPIHTYNESGTYQITLTIHAGTGGTDFDPIVLCNDLIFTETIMVKSCLDPCEHCIGSFAPLKGKKYVLSAWVKEKNPANPTEQLKTYSAPEIILNFISTATTIGPFKAKGQIIDGWQRIEEEFTIPLSATEIVVKLNNSDASNEVFFDDIRIHPFDANMKSFVYDPITLRLVAELDANNYATFYEYDEEGKLIRIKKETERGIKTIQESREHTVK